MNPLLVASGVAGLIVGLLLVWRYLRRDSEWRTDGSQEGAA